MKHRYPEIGFVSLEIVKSRENQAIFNELAEKLGITTPGVPVFIFRESYVVGFPEGKSAERKVNSMVKKELKMLQP